MIFFNSFEPFNNNKKAEEKEVNKKMTIFA